MGHVILSEVTKSTDIEVFEKHPPLRDYPDAASSRVTLVSEVCFGEVGKSPDVVLGLGKAFRSEDMELLRVVPRTKSLTSAQIQQAVNDTVLKAMSQTGAKRVVTYVPADRFSPKGWDRVKSIYGKAGRYVLFATDGKFKAAKADDGRGIPGRAS